MAQPLGNILWLFLALFFLVIHTIVLTKLNERLQIALQRIEDLELSNEEKTTNCVDEMRFDSEPQFIRDIRRLQRRIKKFEIYASKSKRDSENLDSFSAHLRPRRSFCSGSKYAVYTIWGVDQCPANSQLVDKGQTVTTDGSDYFCLSDDSEEKPLHYVSTRSLGSSVTLRGVTYDDIEDVVSLNTVPASGSKSKKNNRTVPCALCARCGRSSSKMIAAIPAKIRGFTMQREYFGILMSSKDSKKLLCISADAREYKNGTFPKNGKLKDTVKIYPAELKCDSMYCQEDKHYGDKYRVKCMVFTF